MKKIVWITVILFFSLFLFSGNIWTAQTNSENTTNNETPATPRSMGIYTDCLTTGATCKFNIQQFMWLQSTAWWSGVRTSVLTLVQDVVGATTTFIGTIVTLAFIRSGFLYISSGMKNDASMRSKATKGMMYSAIGMILVMASYAIIRLIQFIASGG